MFESTRRRILQGLGVGGTAAVAGCSGGYQTETENRTPKASRAAKQTVDQAAADPTDIPDPIDRDQPKTHEIELEAKEVQAEIEPGVTFNFMTFDGQIPGPMIRVRQGDRVEFTLTNPSENDMPHNVDMHAIYGTGGAAVATTAAPGESNDAGFTLRYPGAYIYHCAVPNLDYHISSGMFGMIVVEPKEGLPEVDREFYFGQHEVYTDSKQGSEGHHGFDMKRMAQEDPTYVLLNGEKYAYAAANRGPLEAQKGERIRVFFVDGGPNLPSHFHPIGNVWSEAYRDGALPEADVRASAEHHVQTMTVPPGSCMIGEMDTPVPERIKLVDHALSRVARKGMLAEIDVEGEKDSETFDPSPDKSASADEEGPIY